MKKSIIALTIAAALSAGCATVQQTSDDLSKKMGVSKAGGGATVGAAVGCAGGAVLGYVTGAGVRDGCLAGAVIGGAVGYASGHQRDLEEAKKLAESMAQEKVAATVQSYEYETKDKDSGKMQKVSALKSITAPLPADAIQARDPQMTGTLGKFGQFAATRSEPMIVTVAGTKKDIGYLKSSIAAGVPADKAANVQIKTVITKTPGAKVSVRPAEIQQTA